MPQKGAKYRLNDKLEEGIDRLVDLGIHKTRQEVVTLAVAQYLIDRGVIVVENPDMLYVKCKNCGRKMQTGFVISRTSRGTVLKNNTSGPCPSCGGQTTWSGHEAFYGDNMPFSKDKQ